MLSHEDNISVIYFRESTLNLHTLKTYPDLFSEQNQHLQEDTK